MPDRDFSSMPSSFDDDDKFHNESGWNKIARKLREEPLIPLGSALTVYAFAASYRALRRGDSHGAQRMFRARVLAQGFTVLAMVAGGMYYSKDRERSQELRKIREQQEAEEKRAKWIRELEARDEEDKAMRRRLEEKRSAFQAEAAAAAAAAGQAAEEGDRKAAGGGVMSKLGWGAWKEAEKKAEEMEGEAATESTETSGDGGDKRKRNPRSSLDSLGHIVGTKRSD